MKTDAIRATDNKDYDERNVTKDYGERFRAKGDEERAYEGELAVDSGHVEMLEMVM